MSDPALISQVTAIVRKAGKVPANVLITTDSRMVEDLNIDSLDLVDVILKIQDEFDVVVEDDDLPLLLSVADLVNYISVRRNRAVA
ncbi:acyl carrier protein [Singulisphaera sp. PoT]|uniref:acyl carrier protein n=1 Tax=Singulisphaera sp. PoT TaxID=3411797 RepID=UPI003BF5DF5D